MLSKMAGLTSFFEAEKYFIACIYDIFFIHSSIDGHLDCFHALGMENNAAVNIEVQIPLWDPDFNSFGYIFRSGIAESYSSSIFNFFRSFHSFFIVTAPIYIPTNCTQGSPKTLTSCLFDDSHLNRYELISHCGFDLHFSWWRRVMVSTFSCTCWTCVCLLCKNVYSDPLPLF